MLSALLLMGAAPDLGRSSLVEPRHAHNWILLEQKATLWFHWDRNSIEIRDFEEGRFPTILTRVQSIPRTYPSGRQDVILAIDCTRKMSATVEASVEISNEAFEAGEKRWTEEKLEFGEFAQRDIKRREVREMLIAVCGENLPL